MSLIVQLLALAQGLYVLIGAVIVLGGLAVFAFELVRHLAGKDTLQKPTSVSNLYVDHLHIHVTSPSEPGPGASGPPGGDRMMLPQGASAQAPDAPQWDERRIQPGD